MLAVFKTEAWLHSFVPTAVRLILFERWQQHQHLVLKKINYRRIIYLLKHVFISLMQARYFKYLGKHVFIVQVGVINLTEGMLILKEFCYTNNENIINIIVNISNI